MGFAGITGILFATPVKIGLYCLATELDARAADHLVLQRYRQLI